MDLVHSDVYGPMLVPSSSGYLYYVTFIDDYSKRTWIFFMKTKDDFLNRLREFITLVEIQTRKKIMVLRLDNGGEYTSSGFRDFCKEVGIKSELTVFFNQQENGIAERKN